MSDQAAQGFMCQTCQGMCPHIHQRQEHGIFHTGSAGLQTRDRIGLVNEIGCGLWVKEGAEGMSLSESLFKRTRRKMVCEEPE